MWVEFLLWGIAGGLCLEVWQAAARGWFEGPRSWSSDSGIPWPRQLLAAVVRLAIAAGAGLGVSVPIDGPAPLTSFLGGALAPLFIQDVVRRVTRHVETSAAPEREGLEDGSQGSSPVEGDGDDPQDEPPAGTTSPAKDPPATDGDDRARTPPREAPQVASGQPAEPEDGDGR